MAAQSNPLQSLVKPAPGVAAQPGQPSAPAAQPASQAAASDSGAQSQPDDRDISTDTDTDDSGAGVGDVKVQREFSNINHALADLADNLGLKRSFTVPYVESDMADHIQAVGAAAQEVGGMTRNILFTFHQKGGKGWGSTEGATIAFNADKLRETLIPADNEEAKTALADAKSLVNEFAKLLGDNDPAVKTAQSQLKLIGKHDGQGMTALDFSLALLNLPTPLLQGVARGVHKKRHGEHSVRLSSPIQASSSSNSNL
jgi:hypothetical protein